MRVRSATVADLGTVVDLLVEVALGPSDDDAGDVAVYAEALRSIEASPGSDVLVAEVDGAVVGVCQLIVFRHLQHRGGLCAEIESVPVCEALRSQGIGSALVSAAVARAREAGCYRVQLTSNNARVDAHRFYERLGFVASHQGFKLLL